LEQKRDELEAKLLTSRHNNYLLQQILQSNFNLSTDDFSVLVAIACAARDIK
jgi:hypothetical protein